MSIFLHLLLYIYWPSSQFLYIDIQGKVLKPGVSYTFSKVESVSLQICLSN